MIRLRKWLAPFALACIVPFTAGSTWAADTPVFHAQRETGERKEAQGEEAAPPAVPTLEVGDTPDLELRTTDGQLLRGRDLAGRLVVVEFWASWSGGSLAVTPSLRELYGEYRPQGVVFLGVGLDRQPDLTDQFARENGRVWFQVHDPSQRLALARPWGVRQPPAAVLLSPTGEVVWRGHPADLPEVLEQAMESHPPRDPRPVPLGELDDDRRDAMLDLLREANRALSSQTPNYAGLLRYTEGVPEMALGDRRVLAQARVLANRLQRLTRDDEQAAEALNRARRDRPIGAAHLQLLLAQVAGGAHGRGQGSGPAVHPQVLASRFAAAEAARDAGRHVEAYEDYQWLAEHAPETAEGKHAVERITAYEADEAFVAQLARHRAETDARQRLGIARNYIAADRPALAREELETLLADHPDTDAADEARTLLAGLK